MAEDEATPEDLERIAVAWGAGPAGRVMAQLLQGRGWVDGTAVASFLHPRLATGVRSPEAFGLGPVGAALGAAIATGRVLDVAAGTHLDACLAGIILVDGLRQLGATITCSGGPHGADGVAVGVEGVSLTVGAPGALVRCGDILAPPTPFSLAGLAWYLLLAARQALSSGAPPNRRCDLRALLDLVALGTVARGVPLRDENRVLVSAGLRRLNQSPRPVVVALKEAGATSVFTVADLERQVIPRLQMAADLHALIEVGGVAAARAQIAAMEVERAEIEWREPLAQAATAVEADVSLADLTPRFGSGLALFEPCGVGNPVPVFRARGARIVAMRLVGDPARRLARIRLRQDGRTVSGRLRGTAIDAVLPGEVVDVTFRVAVVRWQGRERLELEVLAIQLPENAHQNDLLTLRSSPAS